MNGGWSNTSREFGTRKEIIRYFLREWWLETEREKHKFTQSLEGRNGPRKPTSQAWSCVLAQLATPPSFLPSLPMWNSTYYGPEHLLMCSGVMSTPVGATGIHPLWARAPLRPQAWQASGCLTTTWCDCHFLKTSCHLPAVPPSAVPLPTSCRDNIHHIPSHQHLLHH